MVTFKRKTGDEEENMKDKPICLISDYAVENEEKK